VAVKGKTKEATEVSIRGTDGRCKKKQKFTDPNPTMEELEDDGSDYQDAGSESSGTE
jgi:hypothetical protein